MPVERYYLSESAYAYPSSNANDGGDDNTEYNLKTITDKFAIKSFVVRRESKYQNYFLLGYSDDPVGVKITGGECSINGYYFDLDDIVVETNKDSKTILAPLTKYNIVLRIYKDGNDNLRGDGTAVVGPNSGKLECRGIVAALMTDSEYESTDKNSLLLLGHTVTGPAGYLYTDPGSYIPDPQRFSFIDSETILTQDGQKIEDWVKEILDFGLTHLSQLNYYSNESDQSPKSTLKLTNDYKLIYQSDRGTMIDFIEVDARTHVCEKDNYTDSRFSENFSSEPSDTATWNGESDLICRSDHNHDRRYILRTCDDNSVTQTVKTNLDIDKTLGASRISVKASDGSSTTSFYNDGSAEIGNIKIYANGSITDVYNFTASGDIHAGRVFNAVWNDYAELYLKRDLNDESEAGTVICKTPGEFSYEPSNKFNRRLVVGVVSDTYGMLLGGKSTNTKEENLKEYYPISLAGRVKVKVKSGVKIKEGDLLCADDNGRATVKRFFTKGSVIGKALESSNGSKDKILIQVMVK